MAKKVRAACAAASCSPRARSAEWTGMNDPESAPSPNRFCRRLGIRNAALNASTAMLFCPNSRAISRTRSSPANRLTRMPTPTVVSGRTTRRSTPLGLNATDTTRGWDGRGHAGLSYFSAPRRSGIGGPVRPQSPVPLGTLDSDHRPSWWWLRLGITLERIRPGHPQQNSHHERMHLTLEARKPPSPPSDDVLQQQARFDAFTRPATTCEQPHQALGMKVPSRSSTRR